MADSLPSSCNECKPSIMKTRRARQKFAIAEKDNDIKLMTKQMIQMASTIQQLSNRLETVEFKLAETDIKEFAGITVAPGNIVVQIDTPPGLDPEIPFGFDIKELMERVDLLERIFVFIDFEAVEAAARKVLAHRSSAVEPEKELSPTTPAKNEQDFVTKDMPKVPSFPVLPSCDQCCEHSSPEQGSVPIQTHWQMLQTILDKLSSSRMLNS